MAADGSAAGLEVYPAAELFPMLPASELLELAADINGNGLRESIKLDHTGRWLVDGRNRLKACEIASVEPRFERLDEGVDLDAYVMSCNVARRHLTAAQRAMSVAMIYPEPAKTAPGRKAPTTGFAAKDVASGSLAKARAVLRFSRDLAQSVMDGHTKLDAAYDQATVHERDREQRERHLRQLTEVASDLAERVNARELELNEAIAIWQQRDVEARRARGQLFELVRDFGLALGFIVETPAITHIPELIKTEVYREEFDRVCKSPKQLAAMLRRAGDAAALMFALADELDPPK